MAGVGGQIPGIRDRTVEMIWCNMQPEVFPKRKELVMKALEKGCKGGSQFPEEFLLPACILFEASHGLDRVYCSPTGW